MSASTTNFKRLPASLFAGATRLSRGIAGGYAQLKDTDHVAQLLGVRRINDQCVELETQNNDHRNGGATFIGQMIVFSMVGDIFLWAIVSSPTSAYEWWLTTLCGPSVCIVVACSFYLLSGGHRSRGAFIRVNRETRKLYYVAPGKTHLTALDWDAIEPMIGYVPLLAVSGYNALFPLYLVGVDTDLPRPTQVCLSCGNKGVRDDGEAARWLWDYLQVFMTEGAACLLKPPALPPRLSRQETFTRHFRQRAVDLSRTCEKRCGFLRVPGKVIWMIVDVFPEALGGWIQYKVPYAPFPKEIDERCSMDSADGLR